MDWQLLGLSFIAVFLAELGDKSLVAAIALGSSSKSARSVFFGTSAALVLASLLGVFLGQGMAELLPARIVKMAAAIGFTIMGIKLLLPHAATSFEIPEE